MMIKTGTNMAKITYTLTKSEQEENTFKTLGRLKIAIENRYPVERQMALLEKIISRVSQMDIDLPKNKREIF